MLESLTARQSPIEDSDEAERVLDEVNAEIEGNSRLKDMLGRLTSEGQDNIGVARVIGGWASSAYAKDVLAVAALVVAGGFMWKGWQSMDEELKGFVAAKACSILSSLGAVPGSVVKKAPDLISDVIKPVISSGHTLGEEGKDVFLRAANRNPFPADPVYTIRGLVGFKRW